MTLWNDTVIINTDVEVDLAEVLRGIDDQDLVNELVDRMAINDILSHFSIEQLEQFINENGGFTFDTVTTEQLQSELLKRDAQPIVPDNVLNSLRTLTNYLAPKPTLSKRAAVESPDHA